MKKRRRLADLYVRGTEVEFNDGEGEPVKIWIQKLNPIDREACLRRGNAAKARFMMEGDHEESELFHAAYSQIREMSSDRDGLIGIVVAEDVTAHRQKIEAQLTMDDQTWGKDNYLQGLIDAWIGDDANPGLAKTRAEDPEDPEAKRVIEEIERFEAEIGERVSSYVDQVKKDWEGTDDETLWRKAAHRIVELQGSEVFNREFERQQIFYCVREAGDHRKRYFSQVSEVDDIDEDLVKTILKHYGVMAVEAAEGKGLRPSQASSNSSEPQPEEETESDSGLQDANA